MRPARGIGWPTLALLGIVVVVFMALSLIVASIGMARFAVAIGYSANAGYAVGGAFDIAKDIVLVFVLALRARGALGIAIAITTGWICLVTVCWLATHATVSTAIAATDRTGTWQMETRSNTKAELTLVEQQLDVLNRPAPPRPVRTVREALAATSVPLAIWKDSNECANIQESVYFKKACAHVVQLRRELAASEDHERLSARAAELRKGLAEAPIVATSDPLPAAFSATLGRLLPLDGADGVAWLFTIAVELLSCFGLAGLGVLYRGRHQGGHEDKGSPAAQATVEAEAPSKSTAQQSRPKTLPRPSLQALPRPSPRATTTGCTSPGGHRNREASDPPSNVLPKRPQTLPRPSLQALPRSSPRAATTGCTNPGHRDREASDPPSNVLPKRRSPARGLPEGASLMGQNRPDDRLPETGSHFPAFVQQRLKKATGKSVSHEELRAAYEAWCAMHDYQPLSVPKFAAELKALGFEKWKSCGLMRYRNVSLVVLPKNESVSA